MEHYLMRDILVAPARRARIVRALAAAALTLGYIDLARGGMTTAPLLLVGGYLVLVPLALLWR
jgi:hypothetical protein